MKSSRKQPIIYSKKNSLIKKSKILRYFCKILDNASEAFDHINLIMGEGTSVGGISVGEFGKLINKNITKVKILNSEEKNSWDYSHI